MIPIHRLFTRLRRQSRLVRTLCLFAFAFFWLGTLIFISRNLRTTPEIGSSIRTGELEVKISERIFIAAIHWNNEKLLREQWVPALLDLIEHCDKDKVFVSIYESGSWDGTKFELRELNKELEKRGVQRRIELDNRTHAEEVEKVPFDKGEGWIRSPLGQLVKRRIPYLARARNKAMEPLIELASRGDRPRQFDKVLWLNDILFTTHQIHALLNTNNNVYSAACALDFQTSPYLYDTFATRDQSGLASLSLSWPFFTSSKSIKALKILSPIPVQSCWNGAVAFRADPFYQDPPLRFRSIPDSLATLHVEASECCLIHADNTQSAIHGVYINPNVRVGYNRESFQRVRTEKWISWWQKMRGVWVNRWVWWVGARYREAKERKVMKRLRDWEDGKWNGGEKKTEVGKICLVDEMQVLDGNGWEHV